MTGASGYFIEVFEKGNNTPLDTFNTTVSQLELTGLTLGQFYTANVRPKCVDGKLSVNARLGSWEQGFVVIEDADVMMPGGCNCNDVTFASTFSSKTGSLVNNDAFSLNTLQRVVYKLQFSKIVNGSPQVGHMSMAVDYGCGTVKVNKKGVCQNDAGFNFEFDSNNSPSAVLLKDGTATIVTLTPIYSPSSTPQSGQLEITFDNASRNNANVPEYTVKLNKCYTAADDCP